MTPGAVLVTGARGKTGREVVARLAEHGVTVRAGSRSPANGSKSIHPVLFDWEEPSTWPDAAAGAGAVYLMRPDLPDAPHRVADLVRQMGDAHVVLLSEQGAGSLPDTSWERRVEAAVTDSAATWTLLRPSWFHQVLTDPRFYLRSIRDQAVFPMSSGGADIAFVDARDIAAVAVAALLGPDLFSGGAFTLTGPAAVSVSQAADLVSAASGHSIRALDPPVDESVAGLDPWLAEILGGVLERVRDGVFGHVTDDVTQATAQPSRPLETFVREHAHLWRGVPSGEPQP